MTPAPPARPQAAQTPVFVDDTGRRHRIVQLTGWVAAGLTLAYLALLGVSLIGSPGLVPLSLPAIGRVLPDLSAPHLGAAIKSGHRDGAMTTPRAQAPGPSTAAGGRDANASSPIEAQQRATPPKPARTPSPMPSAAAASPAQTRQANPSPAGTPRASHSPAAHPTPKSTHASPHNVSGSPTPSPT